MWGTGERLECYPEILIKYFNYMLETSPGSILVFISKKINVQISNR